MATFFAFPTYLTPHPVASHNRPRVSLEHFHYSTLLTAITSQHQNPHLQKIPTLHCECDDFRVLSWHLTDMHGVDGLSRVRCGSRLGHAHDRRPHLRLESQPHGVQEVCHFDAHYGPRPRMLTRVSVEPTISLTGSRYTRSTLVRFRAWCSRSNRTS